MSWGSLPYEIRQIILNSLITSESSLSPYASVCREWQQAMEPVTFRQLKVSPSRLPALDEMVRSRRAFVDCIKLSIPLQPYNCPECARDPSDWDRELDQNIIRATLRSLLDILSTWEPSSQGLTLDVTIFSPSDAHHFHQDCIFDDAQQLQHRDNFPIDTWHGWYNSGQLCPPPEAAIRRLHQKTRLGTGFWSGLPLVPVVTNLQLRRQTRRQWNSVSLQRLLLHFPSLQTVYYEPWLNHVAGYQDTREIHAKVLRSLTMSRMTKLVMFEDFNKNYDRNYRMARQLFPMGTEQLIRGKSRVGTALGQASLGLESLAVSFTADAKYFFSACSVDWTWYRLRSIALTSGTLVPSDGDCEAISELLRTAATVVTRMPRLETMTLWNYECDKAVAAFIYQSPAADQWAKITWRATWDLQLQPSVIELWEAVAFERALSGLVVVKDLLHSDVASQPLCEIIVRLQLPCELLHPESLRQMQQEVHYRSHIPKSGYDSSVFDSSNTSSENRIETRTYRPPVRREICAAQ